MADYFCENDKASKPIIAAGLKSGDIAFWRHDHLGQAWYRRWPKIHGVPAKGDKVYDLIADTIPDDGNCELIDETGEIVASGEVGPLRAVDPAAGIVKFELPK
jgi:hypothetical protein